ncbi:glycosyltransferase family 2 protein [Anaerotignum propionicum]|uniref:glycosyltransferase family 2 protein n=1 Tax=Anaerotignum propionicum TaxID=28446 RepID=UPI00289DA601|nr:glycosyltransferase family 2 protein [Anaerotignum propionicum]
MDNYFEINTDHALPPIEATSIFQSRGNAADSFTQSWENELSIAVISYNRLEKTKVCIENIIQNTDIPYDLILIDSGSQPEIMEYYKSVNHPNKTIIRITKNINANFSFMVAMKNLKSKYCAIVSNDVVVPKNAIKNLLTCIQSADNIGWVSPVSSNISNLQQVDLNFNTLEEMNRVAEAYNISDPLKWEERLALMPAIFFYKKECIDIVGGFDYGFFHDFADDDMARRLNRAGYKTILCTDTWVHHDHIYNTTPQDVIRLRNSIEQGRKNFSEKYYGLDAWDDVRNYEVGLTSLLENPHKNEWIPNILGIDTRCGTPILDVRNQLRKYGITKTVSHAFTTKADYFFDLQTVCNHVNCDRIDYLYDYFEKESCDYIILGEPINTYDKPKLLTKRLYSLLKPNGTLLLKLRNISNQNNLLYSLGNFKEPTLEESCSCVPLESLYNYLIKLGARIKPIVVLQEPATQETINILNEMHKIPAIRFNQEAVLPRLITKDFLLCIEK